MDEERLKFKRFDEAGEAWMSLLLEELRAVNRNLERVISLLSKDKKSSSQLKVEKRFGLPLPEILTQYEGQNIRDTAKALRVSKDTICTWRKQGKGAYGE